MGKSIKPDLCFLCFSILCLGYPGQQRAKVAELSKFGRPVSVHISQLVWHLSALGVLLD